MRAAALRSPPRNQYRHNISLYLTMYLYLYISISLYLYLSLSLSLLEIEGLKIEKPRLIIGSKWATTFRFNYGSESARYTRGPSTHMARYN
jgi:hypothetical protein